MIGVQFSGGAMIGTFLFAAAFGLILGPSLLWSGNRGLLPTR